MNASKKLEITISSSAFLSVHKGKSVGVEWTKLIGPEPSVWITLRMCILKKWTKVTAYNHTNQKAKK